MNTLRNEYRRERMLKYRKLGAFLIALGALFALESFAGYSHIVKLWPLIMASTGAGFIGIYLKRERREALFLGLGFYLILHSLLFLICSFGSWSRLAELWPLFIAFPGLTFMLVYAFDRRHRLYLMLGLVLLSISAVFFLVFSLNPRLWWTIFFFLGASLLLTGSEREE